MSDVPFSARETATASIGSEVASPTRRNTDESETLRRRLQYALDEIAHLTQALKQARGQSPEGDDELSALRDQVETLQRALDRSSVELAAANEEREHFRDKQRVLETAREEALATADRMAKKVHDLRQMIAELQRRLDLKSREVGVKNRERRRLATALKNQAAALVELQRRFEHQAQSAPQGIPNPQPRDAAGGAALADHQGREPPALPLTAAAPHQGQPARPSGALPWVLLLLAAPAVVVVVWYGLRLGSNVAGVAPSQPTAPPRVQVAPSQDLIAPAAPISKHPPELRELPRRQTVRDRLLNGGLGPTMAAVGPATFVMGSDAIRLHPDESPAHEVAISRFLIGVREVTYAEYERFVQGTGARLPNDFGWGRGQRPVSDVGWDDADAYARWLSRQTGHRYRLPSEAEWEYAARGDNPKSYWWGSQPETGRAVCFDCGTPWDGRMPAPVASLAPNPFGLYDTAGNVMEWVGDCWSADYTGAPGDGRTRNDGDCSLRVARGGAFNKPAVAMRSRARYRFAPDTRIDMLGFRVVRED